MRLNFDLDEDGVADKQSVRPRYDIQLDHPQTGGAIWLRTFPVSPRYQNRDLVVMLREYASELSGARYQVERLDGLHGLHGVVRVSERRIAVRVIAINRAMIAGSQAAAATIELADVDQLRMDANHRLARARIVMADVGYQERHVLRSRNLEATFPVVATLGYVNSPENYNALLGDFQAFVARVRLSRNGPTRGVLDPN